MKRQVYNIWLKKLFAFIKFSNILKFAMVGRKLLISHSKIFQNLVFVNILFFHLFRIQRDRGCHSLENFMHIYCIV